MYTWAKKNSIAFWSLIHKGEKTPAVGESLFSTGDIYNKSFKIWLSISKRESQCHSFATTKIKVKPLVDTGVKKSLGMQFIIQTHVCAKNSTNVWVLLIVGNIRSLCGKQLCHYVLYILTIFLDYGNAKTKQVKVSVYCYGARICKYKALYSFWYIQHVYTNQTMAYILCDGRTTVAVHFHIHVPHIKLIFMSFFYPFISMPIETLCQF